MNNEIINVRDVSFNDEMAEVNTFKSRTGFANRSQIKPLNIWIIINRRTEAELTVKNAYINKLKDQLADSSRALADLTANMVYDNPALLRYLISLALSDETPYAQRAARVVAICCLAHPDMFIPYRNKVIHKMAVLQNEGVVRSMLKLYAEIPIGYTSSEVSVLVNLCFDYLTGRDTPVALKVYSMDILYKLAIGLPDIGPELYSVIESQMPYASAGYKSRGQKILNKLAGR